ncbi:MAG: ABC transporter permease [Acidobacteriota bacterium]|nr:ABC transporter permease [Acidobacteriota bacterium]
MTELLSILRLRVKALFKRRQLDRDLEDELAFHLAMKQSGESNGRSFGNPMLVKESTREIWTFHALETCWQDVRFAVRLLRRSPVFACTAVLSLAIGIGANTAIFSLVDALLVKQLPVRHPEQLRVLTWSADPRADMPSDSYDGDCQKTRGRRVCGSFSYPAFKAMAAVPQFSSVIGFSDLNLTVTAGGLSELAFGHIVSGNYFTALGVKPLVGRTLLADDDRASQPLVAVISYRYWTRRFGQDPAVIGRGILINKKPVSVVGVAPREFLGLYPGNAPDVYLTMAKSGEISAQWRALDKPDYWWVNVFARMQPNATEKQARAAAEAVFQHQMESYSGRKMSAVSRIEMDAGARGLSLLREGMSLQIGVLAAAVLLVLLIACANLANLLLARATARRREIAVRLSIGASRKRLLRQLLTEGVLLSLTGGALGIAIANPLMHLLLSTGGEQPVEINAALDARTLAFAFGLSLLTGLVFSALPALRATRLDLSPALKDGALAGSGTSPKLRMGRLLVAAQVGLSLLLLIGAGLFVRTLISLRAVNLGFNAENVLTFRTDPSLNGLKEQALAALYERIRENLERIPGVRSVALSSHVLIGGDETGGWVRIAGEPLKQRYAHDNVNVLFCSDSFLSTLRIPVMLGRDLSPADSANAQPAAVVNEKFAKKYFPNSSPIGREFYLIEDSKEQSKSPAVRIVGVSRDAHYRDVRSDPPPTAYLPYVQHLRSLHNMIFSIRTAIPPLTVTEQVRKAVAQVDKSVPVAYVHTEQQLIDMSLGSERLFAGLVSWLGVIAALLAAIGLYGVVSYSVSRRTAEVAIRMALGANPGDVLRLVVRECLWLVAAGLITGIPAALALTRLLGTMLYGVKPTDAATYAVAAALMIAISAIAALIPARRAARIQPVLALKYE